MKKLAILLLLAVMLSHVPVSSSIPGSFEGIEVLVELPDGRVFWYDDIGNYENITKELCERYNLSYYINQNFSIIDGYCLHPYHWDNGWKRGIGGKIIAWSDGYPRATVQDRYPRFSSNPQISHYAPGKTELWNYTVGSGMFGAIDSTVVGFEDRIFFNSWNGLYCLNLNGDLIWKNSSIKGMSTPYIYNNTIFVGSSDGYLYSLTLDGKVMWKKKISDSPGYMGITSSPLVINNTVYLGGYESDNKTSYFYAIDINGSEIWNVSLNSTVYYGSPSYYHGLFIIPLAGKYNASEGKWYPDYGLMAVKNGRIAWIFKTNNSVKSTPLIYHNSIYFTSVNGYLYKLNMEGEMIWRVKIGYSTSSPNAWNNTIFVGSGSFSDYGKIYAISEDSTVLWEKSVDGGIQSGITIAPPFIYFSLNSENGGIACYNFKGEEIWNFSVKNYVLPSPTIISKFLLFGDDSGKIHLLKDSSKPTIFFKGDNIYSYGDVINISITAKDNMGVRKITVNYGNKTVEGKNHIDVVFMANFTGRIDIMACAEDYDGNLRYVNYTIYIFEKALKIFLNGEREVIANKITNYTLLVEDSNDTPVSNAAVYVYLDNRSVLSGLTKDGTFTFSLKIPMGNHTLHIEVKKIGYRGAELWEKIVGIEEKKIRSESLQPLLILIVSIAIIISTLIIYIFRMRRREYYE